MSRIQNELLFFHAKPIGTGLFVLRVFHVTDGTDGLHYLIDALLSETHNVARGVVFKNCTMGERLHPSNNDVGPLLTDLYQITMAYAYWKTKRHLVPSTFDLFYRHAPFSGSYVVFGGLAECIGFLSSFCFSRPQVDFIAELIPNVDPLFLEWLLTIDCSNVRVSSQREGSIVFPRVPMITVSGPLAVVQLLETTLLNLVNYASLVATNAHRFRLAAGSDALLFEFGLRRAQGPDGSLSASKYCYMAGFDGTSSVAAGYKFGIPVKGTHAHSFVQSFQSLEDVQSSKQIVTTGDGNCYSVDDLRARVLEIRDLLWDKRSTSNGELAAFIAYASVYPSAFYALVDTYSSLESGVPNFMFVALALSEIGFFAKGIRLDSGNLAKLSVRCHGLFHEIADTYKRRCSPTADKYQAMVDSLTIMVSNDVTLQSIRDVMNQDHKISAYGIGTHLVTCKEQPALGCVFKLSSVGNSPRMKMSEEPSKSSLPGEKKTYRVYDPAGLAVCDIVALATERVPKVGLNCHYISLFNPDKVVSSGNGTIEPLLLTVWDGEPSISINPPFEYLQRARETLTCETKTIHKCWLPVLPGFAANSRSDKYPVAITDGMRETILEAQRCQRQRG